MSKFLTLALNGTKVLREAISTYVNAATSGNKIVATKSDGKLDASLFPAGIGGEKTITAIASEALVAGDFVNLWDNEGVRSVRKADASNARQAMGFVTTPFANAATASVILNGENTALTGLVIGTIYYLSATNAGKATITAPTGSGQINQELGFALTTTSINFENDGFTGIE